MSNIRARVGDANQHTIRPTSGEATYAIIDNGIIVPLGFLGPRIGGVYGKDGNPIPSSSLQRGPNSFLYKADKTYTGSVQKEKGSVIFGGFYDNHFGHFIIETISRLWILNIENPGTKIVFVLPENIRRSRDSLLEIMLAKHDISFDVISRPTQYDEVVVPDAGFSLRNTFHSEHWDWLKTIAHDESSSFINKTDQPLYLSRSMISAGQRQAFGEVDLEKCLTEAGVKVVHPQKLPFLEQIKLISSHKTIIGLEGSQLHNIIFSHGHKKIIQMDRRPVNSSYRMIDIMLKNDASYIEIVPPKEYDNFKFTGKISEHYIMDVPDVIKQISEILNIYISEAPTSSIARRNFAIAWIQWASRQFISWAKGKTKSAPMNQQDYINNIEHAIKASN